MEKLSRESDNPRVNYLKKITHKNKNSQKTSKIT